MPALVGLPCVTFLAGPGLNPERSGLRVRLMSEASRVTAHRGDRPSCSTATPAALP